MSNEKLKEQMAKSETRLELAKKIEEQTDEINEKFRGSLHIGQLSNASPSPESFLEGTQTIIEVVLYVLMYKGAGAILSQKIGKKRYKRLMKLGQKYINRKIDEIIDNIEKKDVK